MDRFLTSMTKTFRSSSTTKSTRIISKKLREDAKLEVADAKANSLLKSMARSASSTCCQMIFGSLPLVFKYGKTFARN